MTDAEKFLLALAGEGLPPEERIILCGFEGNPDKVGPHAWRPRPWKPGNEIVLNETANGYCTVSSFVRAVDGSFRRRTECFGAGLAFMIDDVGTKVHAKPEWPDASAIIETSPGNFQWWYFMERERDISKFDALIFTFIHDMLGGDDPGMAGITRVGRLPGFVNGKPKYNGFITRLVHLYPKLRYRTDDLLTAFNMKLRGRRVFTFGDGTVPRDVRNRIDAFEACLKFLARRKMLKDKDFDVSGWTEVTCPWLDEHTNAANTGSAIRLPSEENAFYGAFRCHHGHCQDRGWADLSDWASQEIGEELDKVRPISFDELQKGQS